MKKITILLLCGGLIIMVGCGGNTASPPIESPPTMVSKMTITETPLVTEVEQTEKEPVSIESQEQASEPTPTAPKTMEKPTEEIRPSEAINTSEEKVASQVVETVPNTTTQHTKSTLTESASSKEESKTETTPPEFDIQYWIKFAKEYAVSVGLTLDSAAVDCWDNPISANGQCIYLERDIKSRLNRYAKDDDITDVWIWAGTTGDNCYDIYIGYA